MSPENMPFQKFQKAFEERLPLELQQKVFKWAANDNNSDINIKLLHDSEDRLDAPAVEFLAKLKQYYSAKIYAQAWQYLTGPTFRWVFISDTQPHRYLLRAFRRSVPMEIREAITHIYLPRVTVHGLINPSTLRTSLEDLASITKGTPLRVSDYFTRMGTMITSDPNMVFMRIKNDVAGGMLLLPHVLPSLKKIDVGIDIIDCIHAWGRLHVAGEHLQASKRLLISISALLGTIFLRKNRILNASSVGTLRSKSKTCSSSYCVKVFLKLKGCEDLKVFMTTLFVVWRFGIFLKFGVVSCRKDNRQRRQIV